VGGAVTCRDDFPQDSVFARKDHLCRKPQNLKALYPRPVCFGRITRGDVRQPVHTAIYLYQNAALQISKVEDEVAERQLRSKVSALFVESL
jgi:hypothetical protein